MNIAMSLKGVTPFPMNDECLCHETEIRLCNAGKHYAEERCINCGKHIKYIPKPKAEKRKRTSKYSIQDVMRFKHIDREKCSLCQAEALPKGEAFELDHEYELQDGGTDELYNLRILCTNCHSIKNRERTYRNEHLIKRYLAA